MTFPHEFSQGYCHPLSFLWHKYLSCFGVLAPGSPFPLDFGIAVVQKYSGGSSTHRVVIRLVAHNNDVILWFQPGNFLDEDSFDHVLFFLGGSNLFYKFLDCVGFEEDHLVTESYCEIFAILGELYCLEVLSFLSSVGFYFDLLFNCPNYQILSVFL